MTAPDLRSRIAEERGLLKKIQLAVPGFRGYRINEDLRDADSMLRHQLADKIEKIMRTVKQAREAAANNYMLAQIDDIGRLINQLDALEGQVRHAEQGYSGWATDIKVGQAELNSLYEYDYSMLNGLEGLEREGAALHAAADIERQEAVADHLRNLKAQVSAFSDTFEKRMKVITGTEVVK